MASVATVGEVVSKLFVRDFSWVRGDRPCRVLLYTRSKHFSRRKQVLKVLGSSVQAKFFGTSADERPSGRTRTRIRKEVQYGQVDVVILEDLDLMSAGDPEGFWLFVHLLYLNYTHVLSLDGQLDSTADPTSWYEFRDCVEQGTWRKDWCKLPEPLRSRVKP